MKQRGAALIFTQTVLQPLSCKASFLNFFAKKFPEKTCLHVANGTLSKKYCNPELSRVKLHKVLLHCLLTEYCVFSTIHGTTAYIYNYMRYDMICIYVHHIHVCVYIYNYIHTHIYICYGRDFSKGMALAFGGMLIVSEECRTF